MIISPNADASNQILAHQTALTWSHTQCAEIQTWLIPPPVRQNTGVPVPPSRLSASLDRTATFFPAGPPPPDQASAPSRIASIRGTTEALPSIPVYESFLHIVPCTGADLRGPASFSQLAFPLSYPTLLSGARRKLENSCQLTLVCGPRKQRPAVHHLREDAAHAPYISRRCVHRRAQKELGRTVPQSNRVVIELLMRRDKVASGQVES